MEINVTLSQTDWLKFQTYIQKKLYKENRKPKSWWMNLIIWFFIGLVSMICYRQFDSFHYPSAAFAALLFILISGNYLYDKGKLRNALMPSNEGTFVGQHKFIFDDAGIHSSGKGYNGFNSWSVVKSIVHDSGMVMIFIDTAKAFVFPENQIPDATTFLKTINELHKGITTASRGTRE